MLTLSDYFLTCFVIIFGTYYVYIKTIIFGTYCICLTKYIFAHFLCNDYNHLLHGIFFKLDFLVHTKLTLRVQSFGHTVFDKPIAGLPSFLRFYSRLLVFKIIMFGKY